MDHLQYSASQIRRHILFYKMLPTSTPLFSVACLNCKSTAAPASENNFCCPSHRQYTETFRFR